MSRYAVDKVLREVARDEAAQRAFLGDPATYLSDMDLNEEEREALRQQDYTTLYGLGAHPMLLWGWVARLSHAAGKNMGQVRRDYMAAITPLGRPDYTT